MHTRRLVASLAARALIAASILAWLPQPSGAAGGVLAAAADLAGDAGQMRRSRLPLLVLYSQAGCSWCEKLRREYLEPMQRDPAYRDRVLLRQVDIDSTGPLADFSGRSTTHAEFARREGVRFTPTVVVYGPDGRRLAEPIVGVGVADLYGAYLDQAIERALSRLRQP